MLRSFFFVAVAQKCPVKQWHRWLLRNILFWTLPVFDGWISGDEYTAGLGPLLSAPFCPANPANP